MESIKAFNKTKDLQVTATDIGDKRALDVYPQNTPETPLYTSGGANPEYSILIDEPVAGTTYIGKAATGSNSNAAVWQIKKLTESGTITSIQFADGLSSFTNIWDARASLTYI